MYVCALIYVCVCMCVFLFTKSSEYSAITTLLL